MHPSIVQYVNVSEECDLCRSPWRTCNSFFFFTQYLQISAELTAPCRHTLKSFSGFDAGGSKVPASAGLERERFKFQRAGLHHVKKFSYVLLYVQTADRRVL